MKFLNGLNVSGNVGIGTNSPSQKLDVQGDISIGVSAGTTVHTYYNSTTRNQIVYTNNSSFEFHEGVNERVRITAGGNVGIGTTSPNMALSLYNKAGITNDGQISWGVGTGFMNWDTGYVSISGQSGTALVLGGGGAERMRITSGGNVGIGATAPQSKLEIRSGGAGNDGAVITLNRVGAWGSSYSGLKLNTDDAGTDWWNVGMLATSTNTFNIGQNGGAMMSILTNGNVGIDTASPSYKLDVNGAGRFSGALTTGGTLTHYSTTVAAKSKKMLLYFNKDTATDYVSINLPESYAGDNGGLVKVKIAWMGSHANASAGQEYAFSYATKCCSNHTTFSPVTPLWRQTAPHSHYPFSTTPNAVFFADEANGRAVIGIDGNTNPSSTQMLIEVEVFGRTSTDSSVEYLGLNIPSGLSTLSRTFIIDGNVGIGTTEPQRKFDSYTLGGASFGNNFARLGVGAAGAFGGSNHLEFSYNDYGNVGGRAFDNILAKIEGNTNVVSATDVGGILVFSTKATGGTYVTAPLERMRITSAGNVGIGTTSPVSLLNLNNGDAFINVLSALRGLQFGYAGPSHGSYRAAVMGGAESYGGSDSGMLTFHTQNGYVVSAIPPERMRITSGGNVLINTTTDGGYKLRVNGKGYFDNNVVITPTSESWAEGLSFVMPTTSTWGGLRWRRERVANDGNWYIGFTALDATDDLVFGANNGGSQVDNIIRLTKAGNVGIGTTSPTNTLDVLGSATIRNSSGGGALNIGTNSGRTEYQYITLGGGTGGTDYGWQVGRSSQTGGVINDGFYIYDIKTNNAPFAIALGGNVGIGTTSPANKLQVANGDMSITSGYSFILADTDTNWRLGRNIISPVESVYLNSSTFEFVAANASDQGWQFINDDGYPVLEIGAATGSRNVWVNAGNLLVPTGSVGIGTTTPGQKLQIDSPLRTEFYGTDSASPADAMNIVGTGASRALGTGSALLFSVPANTDGTNMWAQARILGTGDNSSNGSAEGAMFLQTRALYNPGVGGSWNWRTNMVLRASGNVGIGTVSPSTKLDVNGVITATGGTSTQWNTAYSWGNHAAAGYWEKASTDDVLIASANVTFHGNVTVEGIFTETSSREFKENILPLEATLERVNQLEPVTYNKIDSDVTEVGLIAEDVASLFPEVVTYNEQGEPTGIQYQRLSVILLKSVQELTERIIKLENK